MKISLLCGRDLMNLEEWHREHEQTSALIRTIMSFITTILSILVVARVYEFV